MKYIESGMDFKPLFTSATFQSFYIEKSELYRKIKSEAVSSVEFIAIKNGDFYFIEAKSSFPYSNIEDIEKEEQMLYDKLQHTLDLFIAHYLGLKKHSAHTFSECLGTKEVLEKNLSEYKLCFFLVMNGKFQEEWCANVSVILNEKLKPLRKIWDIEIKVITEEQARILGFIQ